MEWQFGIAEFSATNLPPMGVLFGLFSVRWRSWVVIFRH